MNGWETIWQNKEITKFSASILKIRVGAKHFAQLGYQMAQPFFKVGFILDLMRLV